MSIWNLCLLTEQVEQPVVLIKFIRALPANAKIVNKTFKSWIIARFGIPNNVGTPDLNCGTYGYGSMKMNEI